MKTRFLAVVLASLALCLNSRAALQQTYSGLDNGLGGYEIVSQGSLTLGESVNSSISFNFTRGGSSSSTMGGYLVIYLDSTSGGFGSTTSFTASGDGALSAISGYSSRLGRRATTTFADGFGADYALVINPDIGAQLWQLGTGDFTQLSTPLAGGLAATTASYSFRVARADLGMSATSPLRFEAMYMNPFGSRWSLESFEHLSLVNNTDFRWGAGRFGDFSLYDIQAVPEMTNVALVIFGGIFAGGTVAARVRRHLRARKSAPAS